jgi:hypothetical protein
MNDTHWMPAGHELAASIILEELIPALASLDKRFGRPLSRDHD